MVIRRKLGVMQHRLDLRGNGEQGGGTFVLDGL